MSSTARSTSTPSPSRRLRSMCVLSLLVGLVALVGCAGYQVGNWSLYPADIHTVYVPMFEAATFRRNLAEWVTEAVVKEIEAETPFKVISTPNADSILTGRIVSENQSVLIRNEYNDPREVQVQVYVEVQWVDRRSNELMHTTVCIPQDLTQVQGNGTLVAEVGQSLATAEQEAVTEIAQQIVGMMENPW